MCRYYIRVFQFLLHLPTFHTKAYFRPMKRYSLLLISFFANICILFAQQKVRLNDNWEFLQQDLGGIWEAVRPVKAGDPEDVPKWTKVNLPHCFNAGDAVDPDKNYYQGPGWYRRLLDIKNPYPNGRTLLHFEGAGQKTDVYVYTTKVDSHTGGYDEFTVDITNAVEEFRKTTAFQKQFNGKIPISIRTDNSRDLEIIPSNLSDFNLYGGIYRYLNLVYVPALSIEHLLVGATTDGKNGRIDLKMSIYNPGNTSLDDAQFTFTFYDPKGKQLKEVKSDKQGGINQMSLGNVTVPNIQLWSPDLPQLYRLEVKIRTSQSEYTRSEQFGFRNFEFVKNGPLLFNGKRLLLKGTHRHEDHAGVAAAMTEDLMRKEMIMMKEMGVNFIRLGHYQQSRIILNLCDSLGIIVWEEIPWCRGGLGGKEYQDMAKQMLTNMIYQHYNHPSVIIWGLGNENDWPNDFSEFDQQKIRAFMKELNDLSHKLDPQRKTAIRRCDFCKDIVDVYSPSIWAGWYRGVYTEYKKISEEEMKKVNHFLHVEWGGDSHAGRHSEAPDKTLQKIKSGDGADERAGDASLYGGAPRVSRDGDWSESYISNLFDWHLKEQETMPWLSGTAQWVFKDFSTPVRPDNPVPYMNQKGVVQRDLTPKESYFIFQSYWTSKPMVHIYGHSWPVRWGDEGEEKMVKVYSNCEEAELWLNGKNYGKRKRDSQDFPAAGLRWNLVFDKGENKIKVIARKGRVTVEDSISFQYQTDKWTAPARIVVEKIKEVNGIATIQARLVDSKGITCLDATNFIRFDLTGNGDLIKNQGTPGGSSYVQALNGRATIQLKLNNGKSVVSVKVDKLETVFWETTQ